MDFGSRFWVVAALSLGPAVANSFARFAYALLLPAMRAELGLNYSQAGSLNTANALGYLAGALFTMGYVSRLGNRRLFCVGMVVTVFALVGSGLAGGFIAQLCLRAVAGIERRDGLHLAAPSLRAMSIPTGPSSRRAPSPSISAGPARGSCCRVWAFPGCSRSRATTRGARPGSRSAASRLCSPSWPSGRRGGSGSPRAALRRAHGK